jgi:hypothetical protein
MPLDPTEAVMENGRPQQPFKLMQDAFGRRDTATPAPRYSSGVGLPDPIFFHSGSRSSTGPSHDIPPPPTEVTFPEDDPRSSLFSNFLQTFSHPLHSTFPVLEDEQITLCLREIFNGLPPSVLACFATPPPPPPQAGRKKNRRARIAALNAALEEARTKPVPDAGGIDLSLDVFARASYYPTAGYSLEDGESDSEEITDTSSYD